MELAHILKTLAQRKLAVLFFVVVAIALAIVSAYSVSAGGLKPRSSQYGAASQQVLIDSPQSALVDLKKDTVALSVRAMVYAQFMRSGAIVDPIARRLGISTAQITTQGPFSTDAGGQAVPQPAVSRSNQLAAQRDQYRLAFDAQQNLPVITIYAQAPTAEKAMALSNAAVSSLGDYVDQLQAQQKLRGPDRVVIRSLGAPSGGSVNHGSSPIVMFLIFLATVGFGCAAIVVWSRLRDALRRLAADEHDEAAVEDPDFWPARNGNVATFTVPQRGEREPELHREPLA